MLRQVSEEELAERIRNNNQLFAWTAALREARDATACGGMGSAAKHVLIALGQLGCVVAEDVE